MSKNAWPCNQQCLGRWVCSCRCSELDGASLRRNMLKYIPATVHQFTCKMGEGACTSHLKWRIINKHPWEDVKQKVLFCFFWKSFTRMFALFIEHNTGHPSVQISYSLLLYLQQQAALFKQAWANTIILKSWQSLSPLWLGPMMCRSLKKKGEFAITWMDKSWSYCKQIKLITVFLSHPVIIIWQWNKVLFCFWKRTSLRSHPLVLPSSTSHGATQI